MTMLPSATTIPGSYRNPSGSEPARAL